MNLDQLKTQVEQKRGRFNTLEQEHKRLSLLLTELQQQQKDIEQAKEILRTVGQQTQSQLEFFISDIVTLALEAVYDDPYKFCTEFVLRRNKTECDMWFERDGQRIRPVDAAGGGPVDIASFGLRLSLWSLNKNRPALILDEPFKHLSGDLHAKALAMIRRLAYKVGMQVIMVTHSPEFTEGADRVFRLTKTNGVTHIRCEQS